MEKIFIELCIEILSLRQAVKVDLTESRWNFTRTFAFLIKRERPSGSVKINFQIQVSHPLERFCGKFVEGAKIHQTLDFVRAKNSG